MWDFGNYAFLRKTETCLCPFNSLFFCHYAQQRSQLCASVDYILTDYILTDIGDFLMYCEGIFFCNAYVGLYSSAKKVPISKWYLKILESSKGVIQSAQKALQSLKKEEGG